MDGAGGNVKQLVRQKTKSKGKDRVVVQDTFTFANEAKKLTKETEVIYVSTEEVLQFSQDNPFEDCVVIPGYLVYQKCMWYQWSVRKLASGGKIILKIVRRK